MEEAPPGSGFTEIAASSASNFAVSGRSTLGTWQYRARSCNSSGCSGYSNTTIVSVVKPIVSASFSPDLLINEGDTVLVWNSSQSDRCVIEDMSAGTSGESGRYYCKTTSVTVRCYRETAFTDVVANVKVKYPRCR